ncbi:STAS domain-containing protein [Marinobacter hydrocarbonoclasticus]|nr:STAS domain-containing protein [Marinobacter nauticus]
MNASILLQLPHQFDQDTVKHFRPEFDSMLRCEEGDVCLDLSAVDFIDSSGVGAIIHLFKRLKSQGRDLELSGVSGQPRRILLMLRVDRAISMQSQVAA